MAAPWQVSAPAPIRNLVERNNIMSVAMHHKSIASVMHDNASIRMSVPHTGEWERLEYDWCCSCCAPSAAAMGQWPHACSESISTNTGPFLLSLQGCSPHICLQNVLEFEDRRIKTERVHFWPLAPCPIRWGKNPMRFLSRSHPILDHFSCNSWVAVSTYARNFY
jgi:hypothetical protein